MQVRTLILFFLIILFFLEILASSFVHFEKGKVIKVKDLFQDIPQDFPDNFYIFLLRAKKPHFYNFIYYSFKKELYKKNNISKDRMNDFKGYKFKEQISLYGRSGILALVLAFWSYEKKFKFPDSLKIGIIGDISDDGRVLPVIGIDKKLRMAEKEGISILFLPSGNDNFTKINFVCLSIVNSLNDAKRNLLKFVFP